MKRIIIIITILSSITHLSGQEMGFYTTYSGSSYNKYQNNIGFVIEYNYFIKSKNKFGIAVKHSFCKLDYNDIYGSTIYGISTFIKQIEPIYQRLSIKTNYAFIIISNPKSNLFLVQEIGINYFYINEHVRRLENENIDTAQLLRCYTGYYINRGDKTKR